MTWIEDIISPETRKWEEFYRNRWQHDKVVRSTHGVNCTGGCSWNVYVKDGIVVWETQALDYPVIDREIPGYEPRGCQRGISFSWYLYSPIRVKYPMIRGALLDLYKKEKENGADPVQAWENIQSDPKKRKRYQEVRGKGGLRRLKWDEAVEIVSAANIYTLKKYGSDRIVGFSPIPAMSMLSYAAGSRFLQLMGGVNLSFYDWYCDLPPASPEVWGEQTDVCESADWFHAKFIAVMGSNINMTRTPDCHFAAESRHNGTKMVVFAPDFSQVSKYSDQWIPIHAGQDGAFWMAVSHIILKEFHHEKQDSYFIEYAKRFTDCPYLVELNQVEGKWKPGKLVRANRIEKYRDGENGDWKFLNLDTNTLQPVMPKGSSGHRWDKVQGNWNIKFEDGKDNSPYEPLLTLLGIQDEVIQINLTEYGLAKELSKGVPVKSLHTREGIIKVTTVYDLIMAQYGISRGLLGDYPMNYEDKNFCYTPAWQEIFTGISSDSVIQFAHEWAKTASLTKGKCMVIIGAGINHWYHNNLIYRSAINALMLCGCVGVNGGGLAHYVGQEKLAPMDSWSTLAFGKDWQDSVRLQQAPIWHYINSDQWRYDGNYTDYCTVPKNKLTDRHTADFCVMSVKNGWMPFYPQFNTNNHDLCREAEQAGAKTDDEIKKHVLDKLKSGQLQYSVSDPDEEVNFPRLWYIWRGNAIMASAKGHEFFLKHYLGTHYNCIAEEQAKDKVKDIVWHDQAPEGKMDLIVDLNFRMDTSALYSDIILPAASWYEKNDLNSTDLHSFIHPLSAAIPPVWESKSDWDIFKHISKATSELAKIHLPKPIKDIITVPLSHDTIDEISQSHILDWSKGECEPIPGKTMHKLAIVERDYTLIYHKYISLGPNIKDKPLGAHGNSYMAGDYYTKMLSTHPVISWGGNTYPSISKDTDAANAVLFLSSLTNGELNMRAYNVAEKKTGLVLADLGEGNRNVLLNFSDLQSQPRRYNTSPLWSGIMNGSRTYAAFTYNVERLVPWRTLTGRQSFYLDHDGYIAFDENLCTYKPSPKPEAYGDLRKSTAEGKAKILNVLTPHGKWHIHSTYGDTLRMLTLSRGIEPCWLNEEDAKEMGITDNDWVEVYNDNGVYCTRACVSARIPRNICIVYHSPERTYSAPKSEVRNNRRGGGHNSFIRTRLKPNLMMGGYGQFTYHFNYWGPTGVNRDTFVIVKKMNKVNF